MGLYEVVFIAIALGMDSFSLSIGVGVAGIKRNNVLKFSLIVGVLHLILPLIGLYVGKLLGGYLGKFATYTGAIILIFIGVNMIREELVSDEIEPKLVGLGFFLLPLSVSLDSLTIGISLGAFGVNVLQVVLFFGAVAFLMTIVGVTIGFRLGNIIKRANLLGGVILIALGVKMLIT